MATRTRGGMFRVAMNATREVFAGQEHYRIYWGMITKSLAKVFVAITQNRNYPPPVNR
jgi:hypothetical protein